MSPKFGTSGLRGLVTELTPDLVAAHVSAFAQVCPMGTGLWVGRDLRASSPDLAEIVLRAARGMGLATVDCGAVPTPALALASMHAGAAAVMVTGAISGGSQWLEVLPSAWGNCEIGRGGDSGRAWHSRSRHHSRARNRGRTGLWCCMARALCHGLWRNCAGRAAAGRLEP